MSDPLHEKHVALTEQKVAELADQFEAVLVLVSNGSGRDSDGIPLTDYVFRSHGNTFACEGMARQWLRGAIGGTREFIAPEDME